MCGISGIISNGNQNPDNLRRMTDIIRHRGPDDEGFVFFNFNKSIVTSGGIDTPDDVWEVKSAYTPETHIENYNDTFNIGLGHRRLSILDLSPSGHMPMCSADKRYWVTYNGEIYNYLELRSELENMGHNFYSHSDTEVILTSYKQWGENCLNRFLGMWAFAIYDTETNEIFLSRDRFGIKPLYYWFSPDGDFCFGSEIKQFTVLPGWRAILNHQRAYDYLVYALTDHTVETMFECVYQLPSGSFFKAKISEIKPNNFGKLISEKWYKIDEDPINCSFDEASERFGVIFRDSIKLHLRADVPVGTALSGGLDSSAIVCEMNSLLREAGKSEIQKTFSSCANDLKYSEKKWMDIVVNSTEVDAHYIYPSSDLLFETTQDILFYLDEPYQSQSVLLGYNVFKLAKENKVKVLLNGQGADEYLGGYYQFRIPIWANLFKHFHWHELYLQIKKSKVGSKSTSLKIMVDILTSFIPYTLRLKFSFLNKNKNRIKPMLDYSILKSLKKHPYKSIPCGNDTVKERSRHFTFYSTLPKYLKWEDRISMAHSIEARVPFLNSSLFEFCYNLPDQYLDYNGETKRVLRDGLIDILPEQIKSRKDKMGFTTPEEQWIKKDHPEMFRAKLVDSINNSKGIITSDALLYYDKVVKGELPFDYTYWRLISFGEWMRLFKIELD